MRNFGDFEKLIWNIYILMAQLVAVGAWDYKIAQLSKLLHMQPPILSSDCLSGCDHYPA
jgi:hypothetical protein